MASFARVVCLLFLTFYTADGFPFHTDNSCVFNSTDLNDIEYILSYVYNKLELLRFTSTLGKFVGYTKFGIKQADYFNNNEDVLAALKARKEAVCKHNIEIHYETALNKSVKPRVRVQQASPPANGRHSAALACIVYDFYPKCVRVTWLRDGEKATSGVTSTEEMPDGDWYYQVHSHLVYTPKSGEKITCMVEHVSLEEPLRADWDPSLPEAERNKLVIGASGLTLGLVLSLGGFLYYRKKSFLGAGRTLVATDSGAH
ncbi:SLA class II histocompatibility antigen, DQ haplotype C beta chain-like isoform X1 [Syngnathoides biaculeatus]|uniref:SLA class II histocompatibility antigen, DQ haplotype C beta chain-like isoform X1 n=1 Tax=Syngnathoides biaculeatus TaxID=300417 RepID=UPI002ADE4B86|nr:SLA class II histocompatibility antigen, DQ haplotype C beta chain-like isoform X1 [Syngnathoides biaculeatus]